MGNATEQSLSNKALLCSKSRKSSTSPAPACPSLRPNHVQARAPSTAFLLKIVSIRSPTLSMRQKTITSQHVDALRVRKSFLLATMSVTSNPPKIIQLIFLIKSSQTPMNQLRAATQKHRLCPHPCLRLCRSPKKLQTRERLLKCGSSSKLETRLMGTISPERCLCSLLL